MNKFAEIYGGKIRDIKETTLDYVDFISLFSPKSYWVDVTGVACEIGYVQSFVEGQGIVFVAPPSETPTTEAEWTRYFTTIVQEHLDDVARTHDYDDIQSLCSYAISKNPKFSKEGQAGVEWRDAVWVKYTEILAGIQAGTRGVPEDIISELPVMNWGDA